jgi:hypothetical protein
LQPLPRGVLATACLSAQVGNLIRFVIKGPACLLGEQRLCWRVPSNLDACSSSLRVLRNGQQGCASQNQTKLLLSHPSSNQFGICERFAPDGQNLCRGRSHWQSRIGGRRWCTAQKETARSRGWPGAGLVSLRASLRQAAANVRQVPARQLAILLPLFPESRSKSMRA